MTTTQKLANHLLNGNLDAFVLERRERGDSWRRISNDLRDITGVDVTYETLRAWYYEADRAQGDAA